MKDKILQKKFIIVIMLVIVIMLPTTYAIFKGGVLGSGSVSLARWSVTLDQEHEDGSLAITPDPDGTVASYTVNISSDSDVDVVYSIVIDNLPSGTSISLDGGTYVAEDNNKVIFSNVGTILYSDILKYKSHTLTFKASSSAEVVSNQEVDIDVIARQTI